MMRVNISILLIACSFLLIFVPGIGGYSFKVSPNELNKQVFEKDVAIDVDQVARWLNAEEEHLQLIDLRTAEEFKRFNIPGAISVPFDQFFDQHPETWLYNSSARYVFYSNGDVNSSYAVVLAKGLGYENCYFMRGGLNEWFDKVMESNYSGEKISARENALFENRKKAREFFTEINSLPDSLKLEFAEARRQAERKLDGGCN